MLSSGLALAPSSPRAEPENAAASCYQTAEGALEICRSGGEPEGVFYAPPPCRFAYDVQILRLKARGAPGPLQVVVHAEPRQETRRGRDEPCDGSIRATEVGLAGSVRSGRQSEQLAASMPPTAYRVWSSPAPSERPRRESRGDRRSRDAAREDIRTAAAAEGSAARNPMTVAGRDWAGDEYHYVFMVASEAAGQARRHVLIQARTYDFESFDLRSRAEGAGPTEWTAFAAPDKARGRRADPPDPAPVADETGQAIVGNCAAEGFEARGLVGSLSVVDQVYHYFYTDVMPSDCNEPPAKRRMALYLRTSRDLTTATPWSTSRVVIDALPPNTTMRVAKAKDMDRWALAYSCFRPALAQGGPVSDICLQYTADLSIGSIARTGLFAEPATAARSTAYLGLRSGGDASGRYGRGGFSWMTDRYGNLDTPTIFPGKGGFLTWLDRLAPRADGTEASTLYGRPVYWSTWTVRQRQAEAR